VTKIRIYSNTYIIPNHIELTAIQIETIAIRAPIISIRIDIIPMQTATASIHTQII
jgi:hypothetical protein